MDVTGLTSLLRPQPIHGSCLRVARPPGVVTAAQQQQHPEETRWSTRGRQAIKLLYDVIIIE